jgi:hypothetical protein
MSKATMRIGNELAEHDVTLVTSSSARLVSGADDAEAFVPVRILGADYEATGSPRAGYTRTGFHATLRLTADEADKLAKHLQAAARDARKSARGLVEEDEG